MCKCLLLLVLLGFCYGCRAETFTKVEPTKPLAKAFQALHTDKLDLGPLKIFAGGLVQKLDDVSTVKIKASPKKLEVQLSITF